MGENFRLVILCSEDRSDLFFANKLAERFDPVGIFVESQRADPSAEPALQKYLRLAKAPHQIPWKIFNRIAEQTWRKNALYNRSEYKPILARPADAFSKQTNKTLFTPPVLVV